jgi:hypothetical protein
VMDAASAHDAATGSVVLFGALTDHGKTVR